MILSVVLVFQIETSSRSLYFREDLMFIDKLASMLQMSYFLETLLFVNRRPIWILIDMR